MIGYYFRRNGVLSQALGDIEAEMKRAFQPSPCVCCKPAIQA